MILDVRDPQTRAEAIGQAAEVVRSGQVVVLPTDTVYGVGCDAFDQVAVAMVLAAKHRGRAMPPPVLVANPRTVDGLATSVPMYARILMRRFWPGGLTLVLQAQPSLSWDLGETHGTVALRMPDDEIALALLTEVGPMAVTSANMTGQPTATTAQDAQDQLGGAVSLYLDGGERAGSAASTIVDCTGETPVLLRAGAVEVAAMREVLGTTELRVPAEEPDEQPGPESAVEPGPESDVVPDAEPATVPDAEPATVSDGEAGLGSDEEADQEPSDADGEGARLVGTVRPSGVSVPESARRELGPEGEAASTS